MFLSLNVNFNVACHIKHDNLNWQLQIIDGDNIVSEAFRRAVLQSSQPPVIQGEEAGDGATEAANGDTVFTEPN